MRYSCPAADLIGKRPVRSAEAHWDRRRVKELVSRGGIKGIGGDRGKLRYEGTVGWGSLFAVVFSGLSGRSK
jgi:hypothetical protein